MIFNKNDRILFAGDSITDMGRGRPVGEGLGDSLGQGYVRRIDNLLSSTYPELNLRITNVGVSGNTVRDLKARWKTDVLDLSPDWVSICIGVNDVWRQFDTPYAKDWQVQPDEYESTLEELILSIKDSVKGIFILSPFYIEENPADRMRARMDEYGAICRRLAEKHSCRFIDMQAVFTSYLRHHHSSFIAWDRVHPNQIGATLMAKAFLKEAGYDYDHIPE